MASYFGARGSSSPTVRRHVVVLTLGTTFCSDESHLHQVCECSRLVLATSSRRPSASKGWSRPPNKGLQPTRPALQLGHVGGTVSPRRGPSGADLALG